jgi:glycosyltransferase involved in cell wall biosynthesis
VSRSLSLLPGSPPSLSARQEARLTTDSIEAGSICAFPATTATLAPRLSVVIPARNEAALLPACLRSLAEQDCPEPFEVIVVDNDSSDDTADIARALGATVVHEPHPGVCWARQRGTLVARGDLVVSTDADTTFEPGWLSAIDAAFRADPRRIAVVGPCRFAHAPRWGSAYAALLFGFVDLVYRLTGRVVYATATNIAFRRDAWSGYDTTATQGGDELDVLRRLRVRGHIAFDPGHPTSTSSRRLYRGLLYNLLVTCAYYYVAGYVVNRLCGRTVIGTAPHIRDEESGAHRRPRRAHAVPTGLWIGLAVAVVVLAALLVHA